MKRNKNSKISYVVIPLVFSAVMIAVFWFGVYPAAESVVAEWKSIWIQGAPEYEYAVADENAGENADKDFSRLVAGVQYGEIVCEDVELNAPLYYGDDGAILELGAGTYTGYGVPGSGELVLAGAHDTTYFAPLEDMKVGQTITVKTVYGNYKYIVNEIQIADVTEALENLDVEEERLVLYTCYPFGKTDEVRSERYLVYAAPQNAEDIGE